MRVVVGGVSGSGKTTVGTALAERLGIRFEDGDDLHPPENVAKMRSGEPLTDEDRWPWLEAIGEWLEERDDGVVACSALRRVYRDRLRSCCDDLLVVMLAGDAEVIRERQAGRGQHFMPPELMDSQLATYEALEDDEPGVAVDIGDDVPTIVEKVVSALGADVD